MERASGPTHGAAGSSKIASKKMEYIDALTRLAAFWQRVMPPCLVLCFMLFIYSPLETYLTNTAEFWFNMADIMPIILLCFLAALAVLAGLYTLLYFALCPKREKIYSFFYALLLFLFLGLYVQGNYIPRDYGLLDGSAIDWSSYPGRAWASLAVWGITAAAVSVIWLKFKKYLYSVGLAVSVLIFGMLSAALASLLVNSPASAENNLVVTDRNEFCFSKNKNIAILVLDTFDAGYMRLLLKTDEKRCSDLLANFTFYTNAVGGYPTTQASVPLLLTHQWYENQEPFADFVQKAYQGDGEKLYRHLQENDYTIGVYTETPFVSKEPGLYENVHNSSYKITNYPGFTSTLYKLTLFKSLPHQLKKYFLVNTSSFDDYKAIKDGEVNGVSAYSAVASVTNEKFYRTLLQKGLTCKDKGNTFRFIHLRGIHAPIDFGEDLTVDNKPHTLLEAAHGNLTLIEAFLKELKKQGIYDNTAVIILADHGDDLDPLMMRSNPLLLVKGFHESHRFRISKSPVSWDDIYPALDSLATGHNSVNSVFEDHNPERMRRFMRHFTGSGPSTAAYIQTMTEFFIKGDISENGVIIKPTGSVFAPGQSQSAHRGLKLKAVPPGQAQQLDSIFPHIDIDTNNKNFNDIYIAGLGEPQTRENGTKYAWSEGVCTCFRLKPHGGFTSPYLFTLSFDEVNEVDGQSCALGLRVEINGEEIEYAKDKDTISFTIPVKELQQDTVHIMFIYPNAKPRAQGTKKNALAVTGISLQPQTVK